MQLVKFNLLKLNSVNLKVEPQIPERLEETFVIIVNEFVNIIEGLYLSMSIVI